MESRYVDVKLMKNGKELVKKVSVYTDNDGSWRYSFDNLPKYDDYGSEIVYTVEEEHLRKAELISDDNAKVSNIEENDIEKSDIEESDIEKSDIEESDIKENDIEESDIEENDIEESNIEENDIEERDIEESDIEESNDEENDIKESDVSVEKIIYEVKGELLPNVDKRVSSYIQTITKAIRKLAIRLRTDNENATERVFIGVVCVFAIICRAVFKKKRNRR
jgi:hypothetical protein